MTSELPPGWALTDLGTLGRYINGRGFGKAEWRKSGLPIIRIQNLNDEAAIFNYSDQEHEEKYRVKDGDLLVSWAASLGVYVWNRGPAWLNQHIFRVEPERRVVTQPFLYYSLKHAIEALYKKSHGSGMVHVTKGKFDSHQIALPPIAEQKRIVSKIDELFSRIDEGERALERAQKLVERYRQSVLKAAVTGELTREWREKRKENLECGEALLARIIKARREAWEKGELAKMRAKGIKPNNDKWKQKYEEPSPLKTTELPDLPSGWSWASLAQLSWASSYGTSQKCGAAVSGVAVLRIPNIRDGSFSYGDIKYATADLEVEASDAVSLGDLLVIRTNGSESLIGSGAVLLTDTPFPCYFASYLIRFRLALPHVLSEWINFCWQSELVRKFIREHKATSAGQYNVSQSSLMGLCLPIPPAEEIRVAVDELKRSFSRSENSARSVTAQLRNTTALRQSVLKSAFSGVLVTQCQADEPAATLLERITAERSAGEFGPKRGRKKKTTT